MTATADAYAHCEQVTRQQAGNFHYGIRLLPAPRRRALCAVYAYARRVDDIGDGDLPAPQKLDQLAAVRDGLRRLDRPGADPVLVALADAVERADLPLPALGELVDGAEMDVRGVRYRTFSDLHRYCRLVAGSVGRLTVCVLGVADRSTAFPVADALGVALQLTNILRDLREDRLQGRVYLPEEDLCRFSVTLRLAGDGRFADPGPGLVGLVRFEAARAEGFYRSGWPVLALLDRRAAACTAAMAGTYHLLLQRIAASPERAVRHRVTLPGWRKAAVAARLRLGGPA